LSAALLLYALLVSSAAPPEAAETSERGRDTAPPESPVEEPSAEVRRQARRLMNAGLPFAEKMLAEHGQFFPFGTVMLPDGLIRVVGAVENLEQPPETLYEQMLERMREGASDGSFRAAATFTNVAMRHPEDDRSIAAVHVALEHRDGYCVDIFFPIERRGDTVELGASFAGRRAGTFFDACR